MVKIFIDAGHGGSDPGAIGNRLKEKDLTLAIVLRIRDILKSEYEGHIIKLSRTTDTGLSLKQRTNMANDWGAKLLVSVHINAGGGTGLESYTYNGTYPSKAKTNQMQNMIHKEVIKETKFKDRGCKEANFHMLRESTMHAVLTESGFIDHQGDVDKLMSDTFLDEIARGHTKGLAMALDLNKKTDNIGSDHIHIVKKGDTLWGLAQRHHIPINDLFNLNPGIEPKRLQIGQKIRLE